MRYFSNWIFLCSLFFSGICSAGADGEILPSCKVLWKDLLFTGMYSYGKGPRDENYAEYYQRVARGNCKKKWAVLVFMAADNNLSKYALADLYEMESGTQFGQRVSGSTLETDVLTEVDLSGPDGIYRLHSFLQDEPFSFETYQSFIRHSDSEATDQSDFEKILSPRVSWGPEWMKSASGLSTKFSLKSRLNAFLKWAREFYPAENYLLVLWGHGTRFGQDTAALAQGIGSVILREKSEDNSSFQGLSLRELTTQLNQELPEIRGLLLDSCFQLQLELGVSLGVNLPDRTIPVFASSQSQSYQGFPYRRLLYELAMRPHQDAKTLFSQFSQWTFDAFDPKWGRQGRVDPWFQKEVRVGSYRLEEFLTIQKMLDDLGKILVSVATGPEGMRFYFHWHDSVKKATSQSTQIDLLILIGELKKFFLSPSESSPRVRERTDSLEVMMEAAIKLVELEKALESGAFGNVHPGMGIWLPQIHGKNSHDSGLENLQDRNDLLWALYGQSHFALQSPHWMQLLKIVFHFPK